MDTVNGMSLFVDGNRVAQDASAVNFRYYAGYWRVGADTLSGWPSTGSQQAVNGRIDDVAIYGGALTPAQVNAHWLLASGGSVPNQKPVAAFSATVDGLSVAVDAKGSTDDGSIVSYAWDFGDGTTGSGVTASRTYATGGDKVVTLTVTDDKGLSDSLSKTVTAVVPLPNQKPVAAFTAVVDGLSVGVDALGSSDSDGSIVSYAWDFGDGTTGSGKTASRTYVTAGDKVVTLTVTDDKGLSDSLSKTVTTVAPAFLAQDLFDRSVTGGLGTATVGGAWTPVGNTTRLSVSSGEGVFNHLAGGNQDEAYLGAVSASNTDVKVTLKTDAAASGGGLSVYVTGRRVDSLNRYDAKLRWVVGDQWMLSLTAQKGSTSVVTLANEVTVPGAFTVGTKLDVRVQTVQAAGSSDTQIRVKAWVSGTPEPSACTLERLDSHPALQAPGSIGLRTYLSGSSNVLPISARFSNLQAGPAK
jgi:PKD repeat protein